jgi:hypothetical protein
MGWVRMASPVAATRIVVFTDASVFVRAYFGSRLRDVGADSFWWHPDRAVEADRFAVEHGVGDEV